MAKVLQNIANLAAFGPKEAYMVPCNDFLTSMKPKVIALFDTLSVRLLTYVCMCL